MADGVDFLISLAHPFVPALSIGTVQWCDKIAFQTISRRNMNSENSNRQLIIALCGIAISVISLAFAYRQSQLSQQHDRISVRPKITLAFHADGKRDRYGWYLSNNGLGPAYFTGFQLFVDDVPIKSTGLGGWGEALSKLGLRLECFSTAWTPPDTSLSSGPDVDEPLLRLISPATFQCQAEFAKLTASMHRLKVRIDYQSIYGESFQKVAVPTTLF